MSKKSTKIIFVLKFECIFLLLILQLQPPPTHHSSGQAEQRKAADADAVGHPVTVNNGDRNDSEKNEGRLCQNCDDATAPAAAAAAAAAGEERGVGGGDTAATRNYDYDEIGQAEVAASAAMDGGARDSIPDGRMEVDNDGPGDLDLEWDTDHGGIMGGLRTVSQPWFKTFNPWSRFLVATQLQFKQPRTCLINSAAF